MGPKATQPLSPGPPCVPGGQARGPSGRSPSEQCVTRGHPGLQTGLRVLPVYLPLAGPGTWGLEEGGGGLGTDAVSVRSQGPGPHGCVALLGPHPSCLRASAQSLGSPSRCGVSAWEFAQISACILRNPTSGVPPRPPLHAFRTGAGYQPLEGGVWEGRFSAWATAAGPPWGAPSSLPEFCLLLPQPQLEVWISQAGELK